MHAAFYIKMSYNIQNINISLLYPYILTHQYTLLWCKLEDFLMNKQIVPFSRTT